jgi:competence CoiA-like predicted nuclease
MNYCIYKDREISVKQYLEYELSLERPTIYCHNGEELIFVSKAINNKRAHFRYKNVPEWYSLKYGNKGESEKHLIVKEHLYKLLSAHNYTPIMEQPIQDLRPDILEEGRKMAYEIVTSPITDKQIIDKTIKYKEMGLIVFWYFHEKRNYFSYLMDKMPGFLFLLDFSTDRKEYFKYFTKNKYITR